MFWYGRVFDGGFFLFFVGIFLYLWVCDGIFGGSVGGFFLFFGGRFLYFWDVDCFGGKGFGFFLGIFLYLGCFIIGCLGGIIGVFDGIKKYFREYNINL